MPLFTVANTTNTCRVLVCKDTVKAVIAAAMLKMHLDEGDFKIVLARNGAEIDEDELLQALPPDTDLTLLPSNTPWTGGTSQPLPQTLVQQTPQQPTPQQPREMPSGTQPLSSINQMTPSRPLLSFPAHTIKDFEEKLEAQHRLTPVEQKLIIHSVANHMSNHSDFTRTTCDRFSKSVCVRYPKAFEILDADGKVMSDGRVSFLNRLYERVNTIKPKHLMRKRRRDKEGEKENEDVDDVRGVKWVYELSEKHDSYGCVAWEPELPPDEDNETQENHRQKLKEVLDEDEANYLMKVTYPTQRRSINRRRGALQPVLDDWKHLTKRVFFLQHACILLGKPVDQVWQNSLASKGLPLFNLLKFNLLSKKVSAATQKFLDRAGAVLERGEEAALNMRQDTPRIISLFPCILHYFKEDPKLVFKEIDEFTTDKEMTDDHGQVDRPLLLIKGNMYSEEAQAFIVIEGEIVLRNLNVLDGFLYLFLSYYVFNYRYYDSCRGFLEFLQRMMLLINPTGHKRGPKAPRRADLDPRVKKLTTQLLEHLKVNS